MAVVFAVMSAVFLSILAVFEVMSAVFFLLTVLIFLIREVFLLMPSSMLSRIVLTNSNAPYVFDSRSSIFLSSFL